MKRVSKESLEALKAHTQSTTLETRQKLDSAIHRLLHGHPHLVPKGTKLTAASVSKEAGVDRATLYRFHEPVLAKIRRINDETPKDDLRESRSALAQAKIKLKEYRTLVEEAQQEVVALAKVNYRLDARVSELEEMLRIRDKVISDLQRQVNGK